MEVLVLGLVALALVLTFFVVALKLLWMGGKLLIGLIALPFKLVAALVGGVVGLALLPIVLCVVAFVLVAVVAGLALLPVIVIPLALVGLGVALIAQAF